MSQSQAKEAAIDRITECDDLRDFTVVCDSKKYEVHRLVLAMHSVVLKKAVSGPFLEASERSIDLSDQSTPEVKALLDYVYHFDYDGPVIATHDASEPMGEALMLLHIKTVILADKYDISGLHRLASRKFEGVVEDVRKETLPEHPLVLESVVAAAYEVPLATSAIRNVIVQAALDHRAALVTDESSDLEKVMDKVPRFAIDIAKAIAWEEIEQSNLVRQKQSDHEKALARKDSENKRAIERKETTFAMSLTRKDTESKKALAEKEAECVRANAQNNATKAILEAAFKSRAYYDCGDCHDRVKLRLKAQDPDRYERCPSCAKFHSVREWMTWWSARID